MFHLASKSYYTLTFTKVDFNEGPYNPTGNVVDTGFKYRSESDNISRDELVSKFSNLLKDVDNLKIEKSPASDVVQLSLKV